MDEEVHLETESWASLVGLLFEGRSARPGREGGFTEPGALGTFLTSASFP